MKAFKFNGVDFSRWLSATPVGVPVSHSLSVTASEVPGRPGAVPTFAQTGAKEMRFFARLRVPWCGWRQVQELQRRISTALYAPEGAELVSPRNPSLRYKDVYLTDPGEWDGLWASGSAEVGFTAYDPIAYGVRRKIADASNEFDVMGTWETRPVVTARPKAGGYWQAYCNGAVFRLQREFDGTEVIVVDSEKALVTVDGASAMTDLTTGSDFPVFKPGKNVFQVEGGSVSAEWDERWL